MVRRLARKEHSAALAILRYHKILCRCSEDPFVEVKVESRSINKLQVKPRLSCSSVATAKKSHGSGIVDVVKHSMGAAQNELYHVRHAESNNAHYFTMFGQSLENCSNEVKAAAGDTHLRGWAVERQVSRSLQRRCAGCQSSA